MFTNPYLSGELVHMRQRELTEQSRRHRLARRYSITTRRGRGLGELTVAAAAGPPAPSNGSGLVIKARRGNWTGRVPADAGECGAAS
jgi:hypothetical protein